MIPSIANIRKAIYCLNKRLDLLEGGEQSSTITQLSNRIAALESLLDDDAQNPTAAIDKFNEIVAFLDSINNTETLQELLRDVIQQSYQQNYVTVSTYANLPTTGSANAIYRVSNYNGSTNQIDTTSYSEYVWDNSDYTLLCVKSQMSEVFDVSAYNATGGTLATYDSLNALLSRNDLNTVIPVDVRKGGMSIKFVLTSDNKYVQYMYRGTAVDGTPNQFLNTSNWEKINVGNEVEYQEKQIETINSYVGAIFENDEGKDTLTSEITTDGTRKKIFLNATIPNSEVVVFELNTDGNLFSDTSYYMLFNLGMSDSTSANIKIIPNQRYFYTTSNNIYISTITAYTDANYNSGVNINAKVHTGEYAKYLLAKEEERVNSYYNDDIEPEQVLTSKYINSSGVLTSLTGQVYVKTKIYDVDGINGLLVHVRGSYSTTGANQYLWSIFSDDEMTAVLEHSKKHNINSAFSNTNSIHCEEEFIIPSTAKKLALMAVIYEDIPQNECYIMREESTIPGLALSIAKEADRKAEISFTKVEEADDEPVAESDNLIKSGGVHVIKEHLDTVNSYVGAIYENDEGKDTLTSQRTTDGTKKSIFYKAAIPNSEIVVFELNTDGDLYEGTTMFFTRIDFAMSDSTSKFINVIPNQKYFFKATNDVFISTVTAYADAVYNSGVNINAKVHTGAYAQYLLAKEEERIDSYYNDTIIPIQEIESTYIDSSGILTSLSGQQYVRTKIFDVQSVNGLLVHLRGSFLTSGVIEYLWSIYGNNELSEVLEHSNKHNINSARSNNDDIICSDEFVIPQGARYLAISAVVVDNIPSNECYLMRANSTIPVFALETAREAEHKAEIKTLNRNLYAGVAFWGSSSIQSSWIQDVARELNVGYYWGGSSGETIWSQMARMGALPMTITDSITIPAAKDDTVVIPGITVTFKGVTYDITSNLISNSGIPHTLINPCIIAGVKCSLTRTSNGIVLTRLEDGEAVTTNAGEVVYTYGFANTRDSVWLLACHYNVGFTSGDGKLQLLLDCYKRIYDACASKKVLIMGRHKCNGASDTDEERARSRDYYIEQEELLESEFGLMFFNTRKYLCTYGFTLAKQRFADDPGFVVTADNEYQASVGITPECFYNAWNDVHLNTYGKSVLTTGIVNTMKALGYDKFRQGGDNPFPTEYEQYVDSLN